MKINTVNTVIEDFRDGQNIFRRPAVELLVREISRLNKRIEELGAEKLDGWERWLEKSTNLINQLSYVEELNNKLHERIAELEQERRWIHEDNTMIVKKDGDRWCLVLPTFINLQESESIWLDPILSSFLSRRYQEIKPQPQPPKDER